MSRRIPLDRFYDHTTVSDGCWIWTGGKKAAGYGQFFVDHKKVIAHRWSYEWFTGSIPEGFEIDHLCFNRSCVRPDHLEAVPMRVNRNRRNGRKTHCVHGHEYTPENIAWQTDSDGYRSRYCKTCNREKQRRRR